MIKVKYEKYYNDYRNTQEEKSFYTLEEVADWMFGMVQGAYKGSLYFMNPDKNHERDGKLYFSSSNIKSYDGNYSYFIEQIERDGVIIYSCGTFTNKICYWNEEIKQWLRNCNERIKNPHFNFGESEMMEDTIVKFTDVNIDGSGSDISILAKISGKKVTNETIDKIKNAVCDYKKKNEGEWDTDGCLDAAKEQLEAEGYYVAFFHPSFELCF